MPSPQHEVIVARDVARRSPEKCAATRPRPDRRARPAQPRSRHVRAGWTTTSKKASRPSTTPTITRTPTWNARTSSSSSRHTSMKRSPTTCKPASAEHLDRCDGCQNVLAQWRRDHHPRRPTHRNRRQQHRRNHPRPAALHRPRTPAPLSSGAHDLVCSSRQGTSDVDLPVDAELVGEQAEDVSPERRFERESCTPPTLRSS